MATSAVTSQENEKQDLLILKGPFQVSHKAEADLHTDFKSCSKNSDHHQFIPVHQFSADHLPVDDNDLVDLVKSKSDLTVRLSVKYVSERRPATYPESNVPYPYYENRGEDITRVGTGWLSGVYRFPTEFEPRYTTCQCQRCLNSNGDAPQTCECRECVNSHTPETKFAHINIQTAAHVVYDDSEAERTTCDLFFDEGRTPMECKDVITVGGLSNAWRCLRKDKCEMRLVTHDFDLVDLLNKKVNNWECIKMKLDAKYSGLGRGRSHSEEPKPALEGNELSEALEKLTIIVSHPHGCSKHVSIGRYTDKDEKEDGRTSYVYNAATCAGCSGAVVTVVGRRWGYRHDGLVHSGCLDKNKEGFSGYAIDS